MVENPVTPAAALLLVALPGLWACGLAIAHKAVPDRALARWLAPGIALAAWLVALHVVGLVTGSFPVALFGATTVLALLGALAWSVGRRGQARESFAPLSGSRALWIGCGLSTAAIAPLAVGWAFHDELFFTGHLSIANAIQNGAYPPRHLTFTDFELRYHYGFDLVVAALGSILRVATPVTLDAVTLATWAYTFCLLWVLGERFVEPKSGWLVAVVTLFGAGLPFFSVPDHSPAVYGWLGLGKIGDAFSNPPIVSYFFQHPWALGVPLALTAVLIALEGGERVPKLLALMLLTVALSVSQFVLFVSLPLALVAAETFRDGRVLVKRGAMLAVALGVAVALSTRLGGFFAAEPDGSRDALVARFGVVDSLGGVLEWHLASFGLLLPLGVAGLRGAPKLRVLCGSLVVGGIAVVNLVRYAHSWDITKFATVAMLGLSVASVSAILRIVRTLATRWQRAILAALVGVSTAGGVAFVVALALRMPGIPPAIFHESPQSLSEHDKAAIGWLRRHVAVGEVVYRSQERTSAYAQWGGLPQAWVDVMAMRFGFSNERIGHRIWLLETQPADPDAWVRERIIWFVLDPTDTNLLERIAQWSATGRAALAAEYGDLKIYRLSSPIE